MAGQEPSAPAPAGQQLPTLLWLPASASSLGSPANSASAPQAVPSWHTAVPCTAALHWDCPSFSLSPLPFHLHVQGAAPVSLPAEQGCRGCFQDGNRTGQELLAEKWSTLIHLLSLPWLSGSGSSSTVLSGAFPLFDPAALHLCRRIDHRSSGKEQTQCLLRFLAELINLISEVLLYFPLLFPLHVSL